MIKSTIAIFNKSNFTHTDINKEGRGAREEARGKIKLEGKTSR